MSHLVALRVQPVNPSESKLDAPRALAAVRYLSVRQTAQQKLVAVAFDEIVHTISKSGHSAWRR